MVWTSSVFFDDFEHSLQSGEIDSLCLSVLLCYCQVILSTKEVNEKTRNLGHVVLLSMASATQRVTQKSIEGEDFAVLS